MRQTIFTSDSVSTVSPFASTLQELSNDVVHANVANAKKFVGRTAEALHRMSQAAKHDGYEDGYAEGLQQGKVDAQIAAHEAMSRQIEEFGAALQVKSDQVIAAIAEWYPEAEQRLAELAVVIAGRILSQEISLPQDSIMGIVREALAEVTHAEHIRIRVNPFDTPILVEHRAEIMNVARQLRDIQIVEDHDVLGGCVIESDAGVIDATISARLASVQKSIKEAA